MNLPDRRNFTESVLSRAAQYDLQLSGRGTETSQAVFRWRWHHRNLGPPFPSVDLAIDWMVEWLDSDTAAQQLPWSTPEGPRAER